MTFGSRVKNNQPFSYNKSQIENIISSNDGSYRASIVIGGDRKSTIDSGYAGLGFEDSSAIDIVSGRGKTIPDEEKAGTLNINPDFLNDAARIYISEKTDVDANFKITKGTIGSSEFASAIALKADAIRIIGVEGVKIVTRANPSNSRGQEPGFFGIELIAGNDDTYLQPMVLGNNLVSCIEVVLEEISNVKAQVHSGINFLDNFVSNYTEHIHPVSGPSTLQSPNTAAAKIIFSKENIIHTSEDNDSSNRISSINIDYLKVPKNLNTYILSPYNKTN